MLDSFLCRTKLRSILPLLPLGISSHVRPSKLSPIITEINNCKSSLQLPNCRYSVSDFFLFFFYHLLKKNPPQNMFLFNIIKRSPNTPLLKKKPFSCRIHVPIFLFTWDTPMYTRCIQLQVAVQVLCQNTQQCTGNAKLMLIQIPVLWVIILCTS